MLTLEENNTARTSEVTVCSDFIPLASPVETVGIALRKTNMDYYAGTCNVEHETMVLPIRAVEIWGYHRTDDTFNEEIHHLKYLGYTFGSESVDPIDAFAFADDLICKNKIECTGVGSNDDNEIFFLAKIRTDPFPFPYRGLIDTYLHLRLSHHGHAKTEIGVVVVSKESRGILLAVALDPWTGMTTEYWTQLKSQWGNSSAVWEALKQFQLHLEFGICRLKTYLPLEEISLQYIDSLFESREPGFLFDLPGNSSFAKLKVQLTALLAQLYIQSSILGSPISMWQIFRTVAEQLSWNGESGWSWGEELMKLDSGITGLSVTIKQRAWDLALHYAAQAYSQENKLSASEAQL